VPETRTDYDEIADRYTRELDAAVSFAGRDHEFFTRRKAGELLHVASRLLGDPKRLDALDVGCGVGLTDRFLAGSFASLTGTDVSPGSLERAARANPEVRYELSQGGRLPFEDASFDLTFTVCVVQVVPAPERPAFVAELTRVTRPGGLVVAFEHNPLNPLTRLVVARCEFGHDARMLGPAGVRRLFEDAGLVPAESGHVLLFPSSRRRLVALERRLRRLPVGAQYYVAAHRP
jgi:SAM-dependent methyltransferase